MLPNREFDDLWLRFLGTLGMYSAELQALPATARSVTTEEVRRAGWALAVNLSRHGTGLSAFAATDLKEDLALILEILSDAEVQRAFGAGDRWQLVECLAADASARRPNIHRSRIRAGPRQQVPVIRQPSDDDRAVLRSGGFDALRGNFVGDHARNVLLSLSRHAVSRPMMPAKTTPSPTLRNGRDRSGR